VKFVDEYRDPTRARELQEEIARVTTRPWTIMEVCGGQTHAIVRYSIDALLPGAITLVHGPGCPVCVTPVEMIDRAVRIAGEPGVTLCSFGDMLRVPGSSEDLLSARSRGADVRMVYSPLDALKIAREEPSRVVVFFGVGFETTAPTTAMAIHQARELGVTNLSLLVSHVLVPPAMVAILSAPGNRVQAFLAAGHVCAVMGYAEYEPIASRFHAPVVVTGFEPIDILHGLYLSIRQLEEGRADVENAYPRVVRREGNGPARELISRVFRVVPRKWRGIGEIPDSGLSLREEYAAFDAERRFDVGDTAAVESPDCIAGLVLQGAKRPTECTAFGGRCTPEHPLGAPMVSAEGACAAYYRYRRSGEVSHGE
jgi:hydrogenase expression/formation protein HypD